jgi:hypothetical protein
MIKYKKVYVPDKYEISEPSSPPRKLGERVLLDFSGKVKGGQRYRLLNFVGWSFVLVVLLTLIYGMAAGNDQLVTSVFERIISITLILLAYYFGKRHVETS